MGRLTFGVSDFAAVSAATELLAFGFFEAAFGAALFVAPFERVAPAALLVFRAIASNPHSLERLGTNAKPPISLNEFLAKYITLGKSKMKPRLTLFQGFGRSDEGNPHSENKLFIQKYYKINKVIM
ncbi:MAG: hypothetical protein ABI353_18660 [Isosphaeraceae bacterium]